MNKILKVIAVIISFILLIGPSINININTKAESSELSIRVLNTFDSIDNARAMGIADSEGNLFNMYGDGYFNKGRVPTYRSLGVMTNGLYSTGSRFPTQIQDGGLLLTTLPLDNNGGLPWNSTWKESGSSLPMMYFPVSNDEYTNWQGAEYIQLKFDFIPETISRATLYNLVVWSDGKPYTFSANDYSYLRGISLNGVTDASGVFSSAPGEFYIDPNKGGVSEYRGYLQIPIAYFKNNGSSIDLSKPVESFGFSLFHSLNYWTLNFNFDDFAIVGKNVPSIGTRPFSSLSNYFYNNNPSRSVTLENGVTYVKMLNTLDNMQMLKDKGSANLKGQLLNHFDGNTKVIRALAEPTPFTYDASYINQSITFNRNEKLYDAVWLLESPAFFIINNPVNKNDMSIVGAEYLQMKVKSTQNMANIFWTGILQDNTDFVAVNGVPTLEISEDGITWVKAGSVYANIPSMFDGYLRVNLKELKNAKGNGLDFSKPVSSIRVYVGNDNGDPSFKINVTLDDFALVGNGTNFGGAFGNYLTYNEYFKSQGSSESNPMPKLDSDKTYVKVLNSFDDIEFQKKCGTANYEGIILSNNSNGSFLTAQLSTQYSKSGNSVEIQGPLVNLSRFKDLLLYPMRSVYTNTKMNNWNGAEYVQIYVRNPNDDDMLIWQVYVESEGVTYYVKANNSTKPITVINNDRKISRSIGIGDYWQNITFPAYFNGYVRIPIDYFKSTSGLNLDITKPVTTFRFIVNNSSVINDFTVYFDDFAIVGTGEGFNNIVGDYVEESNYFGFELQNASPIFQDPNDKSEMGLGLINDISGLYYEGNNPNSTVFLYQDSSGDIETITEENSAQRLILDTNNTANEINKATSNMITVGVDKIPIISKDLLKYLLENSKSIKIIFYDNDKKVGGSWVISSITSANEDFDLKFENFVENYSELLDASKSKLSAQFLTLNDSNAWPGVVTVTIKNITSFIPNNKINAYRYDNQNKKLTDIGKCSISTDGKFLQFKITQGGSYMLQLASDSTTSNSRLFKWWNILLIVSGSVIFLFACFLFVFMFLFKKSYISIFGRKESNEKKIE